jgi:hypothetical protein
MGQDDFAAILDRDNPLKEHLMFYALVGGALALVALGLARLCLPFVLEEGWFRPFFESIGITASN